VIARDDVGLDGAIDEHEAVLKFRLPELLAPLDKVVSAPDVVDQDVEFTDALEQARNLAGTV
jgi:hypothetical protein